MNSPIGPLWEALAANIASLGINKTDVEFPYIMLDQLELRSVPGEKDSDTYEATFLTDIITRSDSPSESLKVLDSVLGVMTEDNLCVAGYMVQFFEPETTTPLREIENGIWRQLQRFRLRLTRN